jgi:hypothetical protein
MYTGDAGCGLFIENQFPGKGTGALGGRLRNNKFRSRGRGGILYILRLFMYFCCNVTYIQITDLINNTNMFELITL